MLPGPAYLLRGLRWWRRRPRLMLLGVAPAVVVLLVLVAALVVLVLHAAPLATAVTPFADGWTDPWRSLLRALVAVAVLAAAALLATVVFTGLTLAVGDPFYERVWAEVERTLGDPPAGEGGPWWRAARDGIALAVLGALVGVLLLLVGLVPVVGTLAALAGGLALGGRLLASELLSRPLAARGLDRTARRALESRRRGTVWGFGVAVQACFLVPLGAVVVMPAAVAGATELARALLADAGAPGQAPARPDSV